jgi:hypothetical protein
VTRPRRTLAASALAAALALAPGPAFGQTASGGGAVASAPVTLIVELPPGSALDPERLRGAIARELGVLVVRELGARGGTLVVRQEGDGITVWFEGPGGRRDGRSIPVDRDAAQTEEDVALVAVNVVRDQTADFRAAPAPPPAAPPAPPAPPPMPAPPVAPRSACARIHASTRPRMAVGADFVPFVGTSSFDGGASIRSLSIGALGALSSGIDGLAVSGLANADVGPVCGAEIGGLVNVAGSLQGAQIGGIASVAGEDSSGLQVSLVDVATAGLHGAQIGLVEVARETNVQVGLVNVASDADVQIGLVNVDLHGRLGLDVWAKPEAGTLLAGIKHGPPHFHTIYAFEMNVVTGRPWALIGLGAHMTPSARLFVDVDLFQHVEVLPTSTGPNELSELRAVVGYALWPHVSAFAGPTFNVLVAPDLSRADAPGYASVLGGSTSTAYRAWPGVAVGLEGL